MKPIIVLAILLLAGCTMGADEDAMHKQRAFHCTDLRDGEQFDYESETVRDVRVGLAGAETTMTITDTTGQVRHVSSDQSAYIKCAPKKAL